MPNLDKRFISIARYAEVGFPEDICPVVFVDGCNLRCPYCLNTKIVDPKDDKFIPFEDIIKRLDSWNEDSVIISGGECCMPHPNGSIAEMARAFKERGKKVGIATNGTYPKVVYELLKEKLIGFVGVDCKFFPCLEDNNVVKALIVGGDNSMAVNVAETFSILKQWHLDFKDAKSEVRTTLYPPFIGMCELMRISSIIPSGSKWVLQQYRKNIKFDGIENEVDPISEDEARRFLLLARKNCNVHVDMRWP